MPRIERDFDKIIGNVLRFGVTLAFGIIALGVGLLFAEGQTGYGPLGSAEQLYSNRFVIGLIALLQGVTSGRPFAIIDLGLIVLFATPLARIVISIFLFFGEKRYIFVWITLIVLSIILISTFVIAPLLNANQ